MNKDIIELSIGAFLHDIGKISHRARGKLSAQSERIKHLVCPTGQAGQSTHVHAVYTNDFFEASGDWLPKGLDRSKIANIACYHHRPNNPLETVVQQADWLSAGQDRSQNDESDLIKPEKGYMKSIFSSIAFQQGNTIGDFELSLMPQKLDWGSFPSAAEPQKNSADEYFALFKVLGEHLERIKDAPLQMYLEWLQWVFGLYSWCVPSSLVDSPDVSLLDHAQTTAAFSVALYQYHSETDTMENEAICDWSVKKFRLVTGDLSGIQSYIFHHSLDNPGGVSKRLRSRSFYLGLLTQLAAQIILDDLELPCFNKIIDAGGRFVLLVPNTQRTVLRLREQEKEFHRWFFNLYHGRLNLNLSYDTELSGRDFCSESFGKLRRLCNWHVERTKCRHFHSHLCGGGSWDPRLFEHPYDLREEDEQEKEFFEELGRLLPRARYLLVAENQEGPAGLLEGKYQEFAFASPFGRRTINFSKSPPRGLALVKLRSLIEFVPGTQSLDRDQVNSGQYMANYVPVQTKSDARIYARPEFERWFPKEKPEDGQAGSVKVYEPGSVKTFAHLAADSLREDGDGSLKGAPMLAVLKADVDRLGRIFATGLGNKSSVGRFATLSRQIDLFFRGFLTNQMLATPSGHSDFRNIYTIYTGGDDLLLAGPWQTMFDFAIFLYDSFRRYVCNNPAVTISASLITCGHRFPLAQSALAADAALEKAKNSGRNRICVFNSVLEWDDFKLAVEDGRFLDKALGDEGVAGVKITKGFVYRLLEYYRMAKDTHNILNRKWRSHLAYDIARNVKRVDPKNKDKPPGLLRIEKMAGLTVHAKEIDRLKVSATYCLYLNRKGLAK